jgi:hypothetical protein
VQSDRRSDPHHQAPAVQGGLDIPGSYLVTVPVFISLKFERSPYIQVPAKLFTVHSF